MGETMEALKAQQKKAQLVNLLPLFLCVLAAALMIAGLAPVGGCVAGVALVLLFSYVRRVKGDYSDAVASASIRNGLCRELEEAVYTGREGLTAQELEGMDLLPFREKGGLLLRQGFSAKSGPLTVKGWELTFHYADASGPKTAYQFLSGALFIASGGTATDPLGDWLLLRKGMLAPAVEKDFLREKGYRPCEGPEELTGAFGVYTKGDLDQLPAHWAKRMEKAAEWQCLGALRVTPRAAAVFLKDRFYTETVRPGFLPTESQLERSPLPEGDGLWELFHYWGSAGKKT